MKLETRWYCIAQTGEVGSYKIYPDNTVSPHMKGIVRAYDDGVTTGLKSREDAIEWAKKWGYCARCQSARPGVICSFCGNTVIHAEVFEN